MDERSSLPVLSNTSSSTDSVRLLEQRLQPELFRALGDSTRLEVLKRLITASGPQTVGEVADCCGVHLSGVSRHLAALRDAGVIHAEKRGRQVLYQLDREVLTGALRQLADAIDSCCREPACCVAKPSGDDP